MDKEAIISALRSKKVKDYSLMIAFFLIFSFFVVFAIRPNILTIAKLQKEREELKQVDANYEQVIMSIVQMQTLLETYRDKLSYLDESLPLAPQVNKVIDDVQKSATDSSMVLSEAHVSSLSLKEDAGIDKLRSFEISITSPSGFDEVKAFIDSIVLERRLKVLQKISISKDNKTSSTSAQLGTKLTIDNFYL